MPPISSPKPITEVTVARDVLSITRCNSAPNSVLANPNRNVKTAMEITTPARAEKTAPIRMMPARPIQPRSELSDMDLNRSAIMIPADSEKYTKAPRNATSCRENPFSRSVGEMNSS